MNVAECLSKLARGKLSNLSITQSGQIKTDQIPKVVDAINEGLARIYTQLPISEKSLLVELYEGRTDYPLTSEHSTTKATDSIYDPYDYYIRDTLENPFEDDILTILEVWDDLDRKRTLNDPEDPLSIFISEPNSISVNYTSSVRVLNVIYRAKHKLLTSNNLQEQIKLPENLIGALLSYVAYLIHSDLNTEIAISNSQKYFAEFKAIIDEVTLNSSLNPDKLVLDRKFIKRGWV